ncbi:MAG: alpha/beta hydrolase [Azoarcus sp.]|jgi:alpha/beta superfamily hydrolase|nr:alpha/beta hydrolase [Azoarcus sp.]
MSPLPTESIAVRGAAGNIEVLIDAPETVHGIALICHPHPLYGGANLNKVVYTLARAFRELGYVALRPNFRGVGKSEGVHDHGEGETADMLDVLAWARSRWGELPLVLGGFSFGAHVQSRIASHPASTMRPRQLVLVGMATGSAAGGARQYESPALPQDIPALIIHGEADDIVPLANVLDWARPQDLPVIVLPGADHFFHGKLHLIRTLVCRDVPSASGFQQPR